MPGRPERVTFTKRAAQRVANVVRDAERGQRDMPAVTFRQPAGGGTAEIRVGFVTTTWAKGATASVTRLNADGSEPATYSTFTALNLFASISPNNSPFKVCCVKAAGVWLLIAAECA